MATNAQGRSRLSIDVDPDLRRRIEVAAASRDQSIRNYVEGLIREALGGEPDEDKGWSRVSARHKCPDFLRPQL